MMGEGERVGRSGEEKKKDEAGKRMKEKKGVEMRD